MPAPLRIQAPVRLPSLLNRTLATSLGLALLGGLLLAGTASAGTGRLLATWMSLAPAIDGATSTAEWSGARWISDGAGLSIAIGNDARTLYIGVFDGGNVAIGPGDFVALFFDDEGGTAPARDDGAWANGGCQAIANAGEGEMLFAADGSVT